MKSLIALLLILFIVAWLSLNKVHADEKAPTIYERVDTAVEIYHTTENGLFRDSVLMYRPSNTDILRMFDLTHTTTILFKYGPPRNCIEMIVGSVDGVISSGCIPLTTKAAMREMLNPEKAK